MSKFMLLVFVTLLASTLIVAAPDNSRCGRHGDPCVVDRECCQSIRCNAQAHRCQVIITAEELMAQRERILGKKGKSY
ncbi:omega-conotoxin-like protein 1 [Vespa mandarinia]|uniref:omega-conotoxin-like protein 1 n=1 Tax=Vespa mandarinia TaxID=7446 RepID=UPI001613CE5E|nr:omega-conotoxin-like protein 1 [Vespa mandarinia]XP_046821976.1 omega-conotoxin-like protein 1 [Vespa crabro]XP_047349866.1 omega-conotoxin-like protein 1 [Vespa velutina]